MKYLAFLISVLSCTIINAQHKSTFNEYIKIYISSGRVTCVPASSLRFVAREHDYRDDLYNNYYEFLNYKLVNFHKTVFNYEYTDGTSKLLVDNDPAIFKLDYYKSTFALNLKQTNKEVSVSYTNIFDENVNTTAPDMWSLILTASQNLSCDIAEAFSRLGCNQDTDVIAYDLKTEMLKGSSIERWQRVNRRLLTLIELLRSPLFIERNAAYMELGDYTHELIGFTKSVKFIDQEVNNRIKLIKERVTVFHKDDKDSVIRAIGHDEPFWEYLENNSDTFDKVSIKRRKAIEAK